MIRVLGSLAALMAAFVILLQHPAVCWAAETTLPGATLTLYGGSGVVTIGNNEGAPDEFDVQRAGLGVQGVVRPRFAGTSAAGATSDRGFFLAAGMTVESNWIKQTQCAFSCTPGLSRGDGSRGAFRQETELGARFGLGYRFALFEVRVGGLAAGPTGDAAFARALLVPDVTLRVGNRQDSWFELGLGAYDASTTLRPGLYLGGSLFSPEALRITAHLGVHLVYSSWESTVVPFGGIIDIDLEHAFSKTWIAGIGGKALSGALVEGNLLLGAIL